MSDTEKNDLVGSAEALMERLKETGLLEKVEQLEINLKTMSRDLDTVGEAAVDRMNETESAVAHLLAIEAILIEMLKANPVDPEGVKAAIKMKTAGISGNPEGSPVVVKAAEDILKQLDDDTATGAGIEAKNDDDVDGNV